jgi:TRAP-type mannitol/chloroaromatic compound transport system substrate-binding protein
MKRYLATIPACAVAALIGTGAASAETIKITAVAGAPPQVTNVKATKENWIPYINEQLKKSGKDFSIEWKEAYGGSLASFNEVFETVEENIGQVGMILKNFEESKLPLEQYFYMVPFNRTTIPQMVEIDNEMRAKLPQLNKTYLDHNQVFLGSSATESTDIFTTFPLKKVEDLKGHKIGASGAMGHYLRGTGAVTVTSSMLDSYTSIRNGVYEGYPISISLAGAYRTYQAAKNYTEVHFGVTATSALVVNTKTWEALPDFAKAIFKDATRKWPDWQEEIDKERRANYIKTMKSQGVTFSELPEAERKKWARTMPNIAKEWAKSLDEKGQPGTLVLNTYLQILKDK